MIFTGDVILRPFFVLCLAVFCYVPPAYAEIIRYTDENGTTYYVDSEKKIPERYREKSKVADDLPELTVIPSESYLKNYAGKGDSNQAGGAAPKIKPGDVNIYVTSWCGYCRKLESFLKKNQVPFRRYDIEKNQFAAAKYRKLGGQGVPLMEYRGSVIKGFNESRLRTIFGISASY